MQRQSKALIALAFAIVVAAWLIANAITSAGQAQVAATQQSTRLTTAAVQQASNQASLDQQNAANAAQLNALLQQQYADSRAYQAHQDALAQQLAPRP